MSPSRRRAREHPGLPFSEMLFVVGLKVYSTMSGRQAMTDFGNAQAGGLLSTWPSFSTAFRYMGGLTLISVVTSLIEQSALSLKAVETDFAADASGFSTSVYDRWYDHKWGNEKKQAQFIKTHIMCGVTTKIGIAVEITEANFHDSAPFPELVAKTAENFAMAIPCGPRSTTTSACAAKNSWTTTTSLPTWRQHSRRSGQSSAGRSVPRTRRPK